MTPDLRRKDISPETKQDSLDILRAEVAKQLGYGEEGDKFENFESFTCSEEELKNYIFGTLSQLNLGNDNERIDHLNVIKGELTDVDEIIDALTYTGFESVELHGYLNLYFIEFRKSAVVIIPVEIDPDCLIVYIEPLADSPEYIRNIFKQKKQPITDLRNIPGIKSASDLIQNEKDLDI
ncbi:MAG: hypothetical protein US14_C0008G0007 [candidate division WS6 bacterium GW2011_WS6_36_26]|uniref:Uncharacterized protein n=1 Tax=candidate division WS6 bacterium GW2011_GWF1_36_8 TaxID=1619098 RepID=A0A0G0IJF9_9BACT|nr:MAG: hypothetical protein US14_C0008G0007 [candidate division WS6 bacterium GW2011_WS6_36_26]KKQ16151.1 MAG: hypothetical protein US29_C0030G0003 [candidate division WS6 bacterium GW2011_GWF1_36_8]